MTARIRQEAPEGSNINDDGVPKTNAAACIYTRGSMSFFLLQVQGTCACLGDVTLSIYVWSIWSKYRCLQMAARRAPRNATQTSMTQTFHLCFLFGFPSIHLMQCLKKQLHAIDGCIEVTMTNREESKRCAYMPLLTVKTSPHNPKSAVSDKENDMRSSYVVRGSSHRSRRVVRLSNNQSVCVKKADGAPFES